MCLAKSQPRAAWVLPQGPCSGLCQPGNLLPLKSAHCELGKAILKTSGGLFCSRITRSQLHLRLPLQSLIKQKVTPSYFPFCISVEDGAPEVPDGSRAPLRQDFKWTKKRYVWRYHTSNDFLMSETWNQNRDKAKILVFPSRCALT